MTGSWAVTLAILLCSAGVCTSDFVRLLRAVVMKRAAWRVREQALMVVVSALVFALCFLAYMPDDFLSRLGVPEWLGGAAWEYGPERRFFGFTGMLFSAAIALCAAVDAVLCALRKWCRRDRRG